MKKTLNDEMQESLQEWADIQKLEMERTRKDKIIVNRFCAENREADIVHTLELLKKYGGMSKDNKKTVEEFEEKYPDDLSVMLISEFLDVKDLYSRYLESGGEQ